MTPATQAAASLYEYYGRQRLLPTFANLGDEAAVAAYEQGRERLFSDRLGLPVRVFAGARVLEFGSDTGENALCFARWGAQMTIVEPNERAHEAVRHYFERYAPPGRLEGIVSADVLGFSGERIYDAIVAEGFIYTVRPTRAWLDAFAALVQDGGLVVVSYYERHGALIELAMKALYQGARRIAGRPGDETARRLFSAKWDSIPHTRTFESWTMDVLENPFVRTRWFIDARELLEEADAAGFDLYSSWPVYRDPLEIAWHKAPLDRARRLAGARGHVERSVLGYVCGESAFLTGGPAAVAALSARIDEALDAIDATMDAETRYREAAEALERLDAALLEAPLLGDRNAACSEEGRARARRLIACLREGFSALARGDVETVENMTRANPAFIAGWGLPAHFAAFRRRAE